MRQAAFKYAGPSLPSGVTASVSYSDETATMRATSLIARSAERRLASRSPRFAPSARQTSAGALLEDRVGEPSLRHKIVGAATPYFGLRERHRATDAQRPRLAD